MKFFGHRALPRNWFTLHLTLLKFVFKLYWGFSVGRKFFYLLHFTEDLKFSALRIFDCIWSLSFSDHRIILSSWTCVPLRIMCHYFSFRRVNSRVHSLTLLNQSVLKVFRPPSINATVFNFQLWPHLLSLFLLHWPVFIRLESDQVSFLKHGIDSSLLLMNRCGELVVRIILVYLCSTGLLFRLLCVFWFLWLKVSLSLPDEVGVIFVLRNSEWLADRRVLVLIFYLLIFYLIICQVLVKNL